MIGGSNPSSPAKKNDIYANICHFSWLVFGFDLRVVLPWQNTFGGSAQRSEEKKAVLAIFFSSKRRSETISLSLDNKRETSNHTVRMYIMKIFISYISKPIIYLSMFGLLPAQIALRIVELIKSWI